ncbi:hypothetical protein [Streptomyces sp. NPDC008125]|uniref:hypothetical protein n=1 Tax=Streptomyces sp. NPDC008125 TaxID=3364811 RepID=UPI0036F03186
MSASNAAAALAALTDDAPAWLPPVDHWEIARDGDRWIVSGQLDTNGDTLGVDDARRLLGPIAEQSGQPLAGTSHLITARFEHFAVPVSVWYLRPDPHWTTPEQCAACPAKLAGTGTAFVRLGEGDRNAPVLCVPCRDRMHSEWILAQHAPLVAARRSARKFLATASGVERPEWRQLITGERLVADVDGIGPVCTDDGHEPLDGNVYDCCPEPILAVDSPPLGAYVVELLNTDNGVGERA